MKQAAGSWLTAATSLAGRIALGSRFLLKKVTWATNWRIDEHERTGHGTERDGAKRDSTKAELRRETYLCRRGSVVRARVCR